MKKAAIIFCLFSISWAAVAGQSNLKITVVDAKKVEQIMADSSDNPSNYASQNTLIPRAEAIEAVKNGATLCYARSRFYKPTFGEILNVTSNNASDLESGKLNYRNIAHTDEINISVLSITCISMKGPISDADVISGVHGIITIAP